MFKLLLNVERMKFKKCIAPLFFVFFLGILFIFLHTKHCGYQYERRKNYRFPVSNGYLQTEANTPTETINTLKEQRNYLSQQLNNLRQKMGRQDCEATPDKSTNEVGGWCRNTSLENGGEHITDTKLVKVLSRFFKDKTVGSFGDGPGAYKREIEKLGEVKLYDAYDGAPFCEETSEGRVKFLDLAVPQFGLPIYDWILSLEVAEHIPSEFESVYTDNLVRHCREGIVMSWATPKQGGLAHINNRPHDYAIKVIEQNGFKLDKPATWRLRHGSSYQWLHENILSASSVLPESKRQDREGVYNVSIGVGANQVDSGGSRDKME